MAAAANCSFDANPVAPVFGIGIVEFCERLTGALPDDRTSRWPLMRAWVPFAIALLYIFFVLLSASCVRCGLLKPMEVRVIRVVHNAALVVFSLLLGCAILYEAFFVLGYGIFCNPLVEGAKGSRLAMLVWLFYASKIVELGDTFIMVVRGKLGQVTALHVYHHSSVLIAWWVASKFCPGGDVYIPALINSFGHVLMYTYYLLNTLGVDCWWKKHITQLQLIQFVFFMIHALYVAFVPSCAATAFRRLALPYALHVFSFLVLFVLFYRRAYVARNK